jgi:diketogulonate reductase-like aldo/keto reductase
VRYRQLGASGLTVSVVGLGCNNFGRRIDLDETRAVVDAALDVGVTLLDTADVYGDGDSETFLGAALKGRRDQVVLATKFGSRMSGEPPEEARGSRRYLRRAVEASLRRLQTDHIDLYQQHQPDPKTPLEETLAALDELVREGKVRYVGSSKYAAWQVAEGEWLARTRNLTRPISAQNQYNLLERGVEAELVPACLHHGSASCRTSRSREASSPASTGAASPPPWHPPRRARRSRRQRRGLRPPGGAAAVRGRARPHDARGRRRRSCRPARRRLGDRRRHQAGAGARQRRRGRIAARAG